MVSLAYLCLILAPSISVWHPLKDSQFHNSVSLKGTVDEVSSDPQLKALHDRLTKVLLSPLIGVTM